MDHGAIKQANDFTFEVGQIFRRGTTLFRIAENRGALVRLENSVTLESKMFGKAALLLDYARGQIVPATENDEQQAVLGIIPVSGDTKFMKGIPLDMCSTAQQRHVRSVMTCITALRNLGYISLCPTPLLEIDYQQLLVRLKGEYPELVQYALRTIYDWSLEFDRANGDVRALLPLFQERGGRGKSRLVAITQECLDKVLKDIRANKLEKVRPCDVEDRTEKYLIDKVGKEQALFLNVSRSTAARAIQKEFSPYEILVRNKGKAYADRVYRTWYPRDRAERPLEVVEFDDKDSRVFLIDDRTGLPYGRAFVTAGVDQCTNVPMGFSISELHRSTWSALCALTDAILPKDPDAPELGLVKSSVEFSGKPAIALFDNATYNHVAEIDLAAHEMSITPAWAKPYTPTEKSCIEGFNGVMDRELFSKQPGYAGEKGNREGLNEGIASANMSSNEFIRKLLRWAYDDHCNAPGVDGSTPRQHWHNAMHFVQPRYPLDIYRLRIAPTLRHTVALRPEGILFTGLIYQDDHLIKLRRNLGAKARVEFRYDPRDMSKVYVLDPLEQQLFIVPSAHLEYTRALTLYQHRLIRKMARVSGTANPALPALLETREELRILVEQSRSSKKRKERAFSNRTGQIPGGDETATHKQNMPEKVLMTDLEAQVADIDDVEMEMGEEGWDVPELI